MQPAVHNNGPPVIGAPARRARDNQQAVDTVIVEPTSLFRVGLDYLLGKSRYRVASRIDAVAQHGTAIDPQSPPGLIILGTSYAAGDLVAAVRDLRTSYPEARLACLCKVYDHQDMTALLQAGVDGLLMADINAAVLIKSLDLVMAGETVVPYRFLGFARIGDGAEAAPAVPPGATPDGAARAPRPSDGGLSVRERQILRLLVNGDTNKLIGQKLAVSDATVKVHVKGILRKIQVQNRTQAAIWAMHHLRDERADECGC